MGHRNRYDLWKTAVLSIWFCNNALHEGLRIGLLGGNRADNWEYGTAILWIVGPVVYVALLVLEWRSDRKRMAAEAARDGGELPFTEADLKASIVRQFETEMYRSWFAATLDGPHAVVVATAKVAVAALKARGVLFAASAPGGAGEADPEEKRIQIAREEAPGPQEASEASRTQEKSSFVGESDVRITFPT